MCCVLLMGIGYEVLWCYVGALLCKECKVCVIIVVLYAVVG